jgi:hypothetical protein
MAYIQNEYDSSKLLLTAINTLLQNINELPIESDTDLINSTTGQLAEMTIMEVKKEVLAEGWNFNTDKSFPFPPDTNGFIPIPYNVLDVVASSGKPYIMRDWKLYDTSTFTFIFTEAIPCDVVWDMDFNGLTHPIRQYITIRSARLFQARTIGDQLGYTYSVKDEEAAFINARLSESRSGRYNMLSSEYGQLNSGVR